MRRLGLILVAVSLAAAAPAAAAPRPWTDTTRGVHVFNDQLASGLAGPLVRFAARHYDGTQKITREQADILRAVNPGFLVLHYRLGEGIGYRTTSGGCNPDGDYIRIVEGNQWVREWPESQDPAWFYPYGGSSRVLQCTFGWYLADIDAPAFRRWWEGEVLRQVRANGDDGVFMDSLSVPNYLGGASFQPRLPDIDARFEADWSRRIHDWLAWLQTQPLGDEAYLVPNVGSWITTRDRTDYSPADGALVEGFALGGDGSYYALADWRLQADRILDLTAKGKAIIGQDYATRRRGRTFALATYLLLKGSRTYLNSELGLDPEWWPEYGLRIGHPIGGAPASTAALYDRRDGVFERHYSRGLVLVNPTNRADGSARTRIVRLGRRMFLVTPVGGGTVPADGSEPGHLTFTPVRSVRLHPDSAAVLVKRHG